MFGLMLKSTHRREVRQLNKAVSAAQDRELTLRTRYNALRRKTPVAFSAVEYRESKVGRWWVMIWGHRKADGKEKIVLRSASHYPSVEAARDEVTRHVLVKDERTTVHPDRTPPAKPDANGSGKPRKQVRRDKS